ncbi:MAG: hypothetical protein ACRCZF_14295, partial [Gemmataceae bacterium]
MAILLADDPTRALLGELPAGLNWLSVDLFDWETLDAELCRQDDRVLVGVGLGGALALRIGALDPDRFPIVASFDGTLDFHDWHGHGTPLDDRFSTREACRQQTPTLLLAP